MIIIIMPTDISINGQVKYCAYMCRTEPPSFAKKRFDNNHYKIKFKCAINFYYNQICTL